jgi:hypothetical protein
MSNVFSSDSNPFAALGLVQLNEVAATGSKTHAFSRSDCKIKQMGLLARKE